MTAGVGVVLLVAALTTSWWAPLFVAVSPLLLGSVVLSRFDLWPALLTVAALAVFLAGASASAGHARPCDGGEGLPGSAGAAPHRPRLEDARPARGARLRRFVSRRDRGDRHSFAVLSPGGVWDAFWVQAGRPLQIESLGSGILLAAHQLFGLDLTMESSHGSQNLDGGTASALAGFSTLLQVAAVIAVWVWYARGPADRDRLLRACAAAVCAFIVFGKVLSPQFLLWLIPLVPLVRGRRGLAATGVLALALVLTQLWFPYRYWELALEFDSLASWLVLL